MSAYDAYERLHQRYLEKKASDNPDHVHWFLCDHGIWEKDEDFNAKVFSGWVEPDGTFHGVSFGKHLQYAGIILGKTENELERAGWLKTCCQRNKVYFAGELYGQKITAEQRRVIKDKGFKIRTDLDKGATK